MIDRRLAPLCLVLLLTSCGGVPVEREYDLLNITGRWYAVFHMKPSAVESWSCGTTAVCTDLLPPGAGVRGRFFDDFPETLGCPRSLDFRIWLFKRVNDGVPIGEDPGEEVMPEPVARGEFKNINACSNDPFIRVFNAVLRESEEGAGVVDFSTVYPPPKFLNDNMLPEPSPLPDRARAEPLEGHVLDPHGQPIAGIGLLLRTRVRLNLDGTNLPPCCSDGPSPPQPFSSLSDQELHNCCVTEPIDVAVTDAEGYFEFDRPEGVYLIEPFGNDYEFRPVGVVVDTPIDNILIIAEPLEP